MKFYFGPPERVEPPLGKKWCPVKSPDRDKTIGFIIFIIIIAILITDGYFSAVFDSKFAIFSSPFSWITMILLITMTFILHEIIHAVFSPGGLFNKKCGFGIWPARGIVYVATSGELSKARYLLMITAPFVLITLLPFIILPTIGYFSIALGYIGGINAIASSVDILYFFIVMKGVPRDSILFMGCGRLIWRHSTASEPESPKLTDTDGGGHKIP
jgi:hypothetical protein